MPRLPRFTLVFAPEAVDHIAVIERRHHRLIQRVIDEQLSYTPETETRNRKPLRQPAPFEATWELRFGPKNRFRVLYGVDHERREVQIQAIGVKKGNRLLVGGEEVEL